MGSPASFLLIGLFLLWLVFTKRAKKMFDAILNKDSSGNDGSNTTLVGGGNGESSLIPLQMGTSNQFGGLTNIAYTGSSTNPYAVLEGMNPNPYTRYLGPPIRGAPTSNTASHPLLLDSNWWAENVGQGSYW